MEALNKDKVPADAIEAFQKIQNSIEWWYDYDTKFIRREYVDKLRDLNVAFRKLKNAANKQ